MSVDDWGALTPERVSRWITFNRGHADWVYSAAEESMAARQAEGVAGLWNKLALHDAALLADEVGTGKTLQALGVMSLLWKKNKHAKVLVMAPNRDICRHWERELRKFVKNHYRASDDVVRRAADGGPVHEPQLCWRLGDLAEAVEAGPGCLFITTIYALSTLVRGESGEGFDKLVGAADAAKNIHRRLMRALDERGFDLLVVDEAHYFRNNEGQSQRAVAAHEFFGTQGKRLGRKALLMTATPSHSSMDNITAILSYVTDVGIDTHEELLKKYSLRRLRRMKGRDGTYDKYSYRNETAIEADFGQDPAAELFFALYQKLLVKQQIADGKRFLYGYLEGFESFETHSHDDKPDAEVDQSGRDFKGASDTEILKRLARMHRSLGKLPAHPKYDALVNQCVARDVFDARLDVHEHKHLVFVRRIPSVREIAKRINAAYDLQFGRRITKALALEDPEAEKWEASHWSRKTFKGFFTSDAKDDEEHPTSLLDSEGDAPQGHVDADADVHSKIADLFVVKKSGERSTDCSNFSLRLRKPESLFSLLLEPASDYRNGRYRHYYRKAAGDRLRDEYGLAARDTRHARAGARAAVVPSEKFDFARPMPTLWGAMYDLLTQAERERIESWLERDMGIAESFGTYIKNGFLFASPVIVELYCWNLEFRKIQKTGDAQQRYLSFVAFIKGKLTRSVILAYFRAALETFEALCEDISGHALTGWNHDWHVLTGLNSPALYASSAVTDRQRLILGFNSPFYPNVLAATSVLQEGVNLHLQCRKIHHYGIAWTPGDNEQRVGRVDRLFGKVNALLERDGSAELAIHYPYLVRSFDEEQLASFIRLKHEVEERMDGCRHSGFSSEIDLRHVGEMWRNYLRKPGRDMKSVVLSDPFPFMRDEKPANDY
ncbi:RNA polymerase-associated protein RapA [Paraburkholderia aspalathi]|uniref:DEAD/DEAH box helicase n=1 Tax=Paraburkholderia aspalathi TaxID=1324617 RepID=UPI00190B3824|nr:DEAD/DEAH box helicase family protein [Paraburkholderia aspalathi]MBK3844235.1 DEAD/DEAH box helicase family protein [Paraburkholderia aspalathi]CAE6869552.1 RNA polymerase-associated protein RapA [Paraburkholderia aspalathi]